MKQNINAEPIAPWVRLFGVARGVVEVAAGAQVGLWIAGLIGGAWAGHLAWLLSSGGAGSVGALAASASAGSALLGHVLLQTFLNTGLFITVHDAIHGLVFPGHPKVNRALGICLATAYAGLSYQQLAQNHWLHHGAPMAASDPDAYPRECPGFWPWYFKFLGRYWGFNPLVKLALFLFILIFVGNVSPLRLVIFWAVPLCLSSLQLFYFGTYQPHRWHDRGAAPERDRAICAQSPDRPWLISLVACYHFSYHQEHHDYPDVAWWALPSLYRSLQQQPSQSPRSPKLGPKIEPKSGLKIGPKTWPDRCLELPPAAPLRLSQLD